MKTKGFASVLIWALFECDRAYGLKHAAVRTNGCSPSSA